MRVITVRQPWAWAIVHGGKDVENRTRNIAGSYRGPVAIHAALADADNAPDSVWLDAMRDRDTTVLREPGKSLARWQPRGVVIGVVDLADVHTDEECYDRSLREVMRLYRNDLAAFKALPDAGAGGLAGKVRHCSPWAMEEHHHLVMDHSRPLAVPIAAKGRLGLWTPDADLLAAIREQVPA